MAELMHENQQVIYLDADLAGAMGTAGLFQEFPQQAFDMGIMEANMIGVGAGMSIKGKFPLYTVLAHLLPGDVQTRLSYQAATIMQI